MQDNELVTINQQKPGAYVVQFKNRDILDTENNALRTQLEDFLANRKGNEKRTLILDVSNIRYTSNEFLGTLINVNMGLRTHGEPGVIIANPQRELAEILRITKLSKLLTITDSVESAMNPPAVSAAR